MKNTIKNLLFLGLVTLTTLSTQGMFIPYDSANAIEMVRKAVTEPDAQKQALQDLFKLAITENDPRIKFDNTTKTITIDSAAINAIIAKYTGAETKTKSEATKSSSTSSASSSTSATSSTETKVKAEKCAFGDCHALPKELQGKNIYYLSITSQKAAECGYYAAGNAWAIQSLLDKDAVITAKAIDNERGQIGHTQAITNEVIEKQLNEWKVKNAYTMGLKPLIHFLGKSKLSPIEFKNPYDDSVFKALKNNTIKHAFFICHTGGFHWFLIAVIKDGSKANILCLDSLNTEMKPTMYIAKTGTSTTDPRAAYLMHMYDILHSQKAGTSQDEAVARAIEASLK